MVKLTNNEKLLLLNKLIEEANKGKKWKLIKDECDKWHEFEKDEYYLVKWPEFEDCLEIKGYVYILEKIDKEIGDTEFIVAKFVFLNGDEKYFFTEDKYYEFEEKGY